VRLIIATCNNILSSRSRFTHTHTHTEFIMIFFCFDSDRKTQSLRVHSAAKISQPPACLGTFGIALNALHMYSGFFGIDIKSASSTTKTPIATPKLPNINICLHLQNSSSVTQSILILDICCTCTLVATKSSGRLTAPAQARTHPCGQHKTTLIKSPAARIQPEMYKSGFLFGTLTIF